MSAAEGKAWVAVGPQGGCSACDAGQGCGAGLFGRLLRRKPVTLQVRNPDGYPVGRSVVLGIPELFFLRLVLRLYALPLLAGLAGAVICHQVSEAYGWNGAILDLFTLAGLIGFAWLAMPGRRRNSPLGVIDEQITLSAAPGMATCAAVEPEPRH